jgi:Rrf2 family protein
MQMTLQRRTELALRALRALDATRGTVSGAALASRIETTPTYLPQVMAPLVAAGWVASGRGPNGGYTLREAARQISMLELIDVSEGSIPSDRCVLRGGPCGHGPLCAMHDSWQQAQAALVRELDGIPVFEPALRKE